MRRRLLIPLLCGLWPLLAAAAPEPLPFEPPLPDLTVFLSVRFPTLEKPEIALPDVEPLLPPISAPALPSPTLAPDLSWKPHASLPQPGLLPCNPLGTVLGVPIQLLDCGRFRYSRGEFEEARDALEGAVRGSQDQLLVTEARYWLGEALLRLGRLDIAEQQFSLVLQVDPKSEAGDYARYSLGWIGLRLATPSAALTHFDTLLKGRLVADLIPHARHGRALALYGTDRLADARQEWQALSERPLPSQLQHEVIFWLGEAVGRSGEPVKAVEILNRFTSVALQSLRLESGIFRMGWWAIEAGQPLEAMKSFRWLLSAFPRTQEMAWARYGIVKASLLLNDLGGARREAQELRSAFPSHSLVLVSLLDLTHALLARGTFAEAGSLLQELQGLPPLQSAREQAQFTEYVSFLKAEALRRQGALSEAKAQYDAARAVNPSGELAAQAGYRAGQVAFFQRDYARAKAEVEPLLSRPLPEQLMAASLLLVGEASYWGRQYETARSAYERFLREFPQRSEAALAQASLGWAEFRLGRTGQASQSLAAFASNSPGHPEAPNALLLAAELALKDGNSLEGRNLLDRLINQSPSARQVDTALANRAILLLKAGQAEAASAELRDLLLRSPRASNTGQTHLAYGVARLQEKDAEGALAEFQTTLRAGDNPLARLGLGWAAWLSKQWETAGQAFRQVRTTRDPELRQLAEYGLAATAYARGAREEFKGLATGFLRVSPRHTVAPRLLYLLTGVAIEAKEWSEAEKLALRVATDYPASELSDDALFRVADAAERAGEGKVSRAMYRALMDRFRQSPFFEEARLGLGLSLAKSGDAAAAKPILSEFVAANPRDPRLPETLLTLAKSQESAGDAPNAKLSYGQLVHEFPQNPASIEARVGQGRLLLQEGRWEEARQLLEGALEAGEGQTAAQAAFTLGEGYKKSGHHEEAVEAYMTAAYVAPDSSWGQRALLNAGESLQALKRPEAAAAVYQKLLNRPGVDPALAKPARQALEQLGRTEESSKR